MREIITVQGKQNSPWGVEGGRSQEQKGPDDDPVALRLEAGTVDPHAKATWLALVEEAGEEGWEGSQGAQATWGWAELARNRRLRAVWNQ